MIIDTFMFFNELDLLEIRLNELDSYVDKFVICESKKTHSGLTKPLHYFENQDKFKKFKNKIIHLVCDFNSPNPWKNEFDQRNFISESFSNLKDEDIILLSDVDEIPNLEKIKDYTFQHNKIYNLIQKLHFYYLNVICDNIAWEGSQAFTYKTYKDSGNALSEIRRNNNRGFDSKLCAIDKLKIDSSGWHFSYLGGYEKVKEKMISFMHQEMVNSKILMETELKNKLNQLQWIFNDEHQVNLKQISIDNTYPKYILENIEKFKHLIKG